MKDMNTYDEVWAVDAERVQAFFRDRGATADMVTILPLPERSIGSFTVPQTRILLRGDRADELYRQFCLHFMTAGG